MIASYGDTNIESNPTYVGSTHTYTITNPCVHENKQKLDGKTNRRQERAQKRAKSKV